MMREFSKKSRFLTWIAAALIGQTAVPNLSRAGVFDMPHFVSEGNFAVGIEPQLDLTSGAGMAANFKYTQGINELMNATGIIGTGGGAYGFRFGGATSFDFFPDTSNQPGIGVAAQAIYYERSDQFPGNQLQVTGIPYIHKTFSNRGMDVEPFFSMPLGMGFTSNQYLWLSTAVVGAMFKTSENIRYVTELGVNINNTESYFSGGIAYYH